MIYRHFLEEKKKKNPARKSVLRTTLGVNTEKVQIYLCPVADTELAPPLTFVVSHGPSAWEADPDIRRPTSPPSFKLPDTEVRTLLTGLTARAHWPTTLIKTTWSAAPSSSHLLWQSIIGWGTWIWASSVAMVAVSEWWFSQGFHSLPLKVLCLRSGPGKPGLLVTLWARLTLSMQVVNCSFSKPSFWNVVGSSGSGWSSRCVLQSDFEISS